MDVSLASYTNVNQQQTKCVYGHFVINLFARQIWRQSHRLELSLAEWRLLTFMLQHNGWVLSREDLLLAVWECSDFSYSRALDTLIWRLRTKIELNPKRPCYLVTVRGVGYKLMSDSKELQLSDLAN